MMWASIVRCLGCLLSPMQFSAPWSVNKLHEIHPTPGLDQYPFVGKTDMWVVHHSLLLVCRFPVMAPKEQRILCQMVSSEMNSKNLRHDCADSALLWPCSKECPCKEMEKEMDTLLPQELVAQKSWQAGRQVQFQFLFPEMLLQWNASTSKLGRAW